MAEHDRRRAGPDAEPGEPEPAADRSTLHLASGEDAIDAIEWDDRLDAILAHGDARDQAAERRDRQADERATANRDPHAVIDRDWAARDRDRAAADRADLVALMRKRQDRPGPRGGHHA